MKITAKEQLEAVTHYAAKAIADSTETNPLPLVYYGGLVCMLDIVRQFTDRPDATVQEITDYIRSECESTAFMLDNWEQFKDHVLDEVADALATKDEES